MDTKTLGHTSRQLLAGIPLSPLTHGGVSRMLPTKHSRPHAAGSVAGMFSASRSRFPCWTDRSSSQNLPPLDPHFCLAYRYTRMSTLRQHSSLGCTHELQIKLWGSLWARLKVVRIMRSPEPSVRSRLIDGSRFACGALPSQRRWQVSRRHGLSQPTSRGSSLGGFVAFLTTTSVSFQLPSGLLVVDVDVPGPRCANQGHSRYSVRHRHRSNPKRRTSPLFQDEHRNWCGEVRV